MPISPSVAAARLSDALKIRSGPKASSKNAQRKK